MRSLKTIKKQRCGWLFIYGSLLLFIPFFNLPATAQTIKLVKFVYGKATIVFSNAAKFGESDTYIIRLRKDQNYQIEVEWKGEDITNEPFRLAGYTIIFPNGKKMSNPQVGFLQPPQTGNYKIVVSPMTTRTDYRYRIIFIKY